MTWVRNPIPTNTDTPTAAASKLPKNRNGAAPKLRKDTARCNSETAHQGRQTDRSRGLNKLTGGVLTGETILPRTGASASARAAAVKVRNPSPISITVAIPINGNEMWRSRFPIGLNDGRIPLGFALA